MPQFDVAGALGAGYSPQEITDYLAANPDQAGGFRVADAIKGGYSPSEITDHLNPNVARPSQQGVPILAPVQRGIAHASQEAANLAQDLGFPETAADIRSRIPQGDLTAPQASADLAAQLKAGHIGSALADIPSAALEQAVPVAGGLAGGLVTGGAGPAAALAGRLGGGAAIGAVTQGDAIARQRAANNGNTTPTGGDLAVGLLGGAATGAAGATGLGGGGAGIGGAVGAALKHAGADALQPELASLAGSVGTTAGPQNASASDMAASALTGLGVRGAMGVPAIAEGVRRVATPAGRADAATDVYGAMTPDQQGQSATLAGAAQDVAAAKGDTAGPAPATSQQAARSAAVGYAARVGDLANELDKQGVLPDDGVATIRTATKAALDPNALLTQGHLDDIGALGLDPQTTGLIGTALQRINTLTAPDLTTTSTGPVEGFMRGPAASVLGGALGSVSGLHGAALGAMTGQVLRPVVSAAAGPVGAMVDRMLGTSSPSLLAKGQRAATMLDAAGVTVPDTMAGLSAAMSASNDAVASQARLMGLDPAKALSAGLDAAQGDKFKLDYADAQAMNRQFNQQGGPQPQPAQAPVVAPVQGPPQAPVPAPMASPASPAPVPVTTAAPMSAPATAPAVSPEILQAAQLRSQIQRATGPASGPAPGPQDANNPIAAAQARVMAANPTGPTATQAALASLSQPMPGMEGLSREALVQGQLLPDWQYGVGTDVLKALQLRGMPKNLSPAQVSEAAVRSLQAKQAFSPAFADAMMAHQGRVVRGVYNAIRNEALLSHGVDMRTLAAQQATATPAMQMAAE